MRWFVAFLCVCIAAPAAAQSTYVGASLVGDISRFSKVDVDDDDGLTGLSNPSIDSEALALGVVVGRALGERWGVELEFVRSGEVEQRLSRRVSLPSLPTFTPGLPGPIVLPPLPFPIPDIELAVESEQQRTTIGATAWVRQEIGDRIELAYLGGILFARTEIERRFNVTDRRLAILIPIPETSLIDYQAGPTVGVDASFKFGDHTALVAGTRMSAVSIEGQRGWLIRPSVGVRWRF